MKSYVRVMILICMLLGVSSMTLANLPVAVLPAGSTRATLQTQVQLEQRALMRTTAQWQIIQTKMQTRLKASHQWVMAEELTRLTTEYAAAEAALESTRLALQQVHAAIQAGQQRLSTLQQNWQDQVLVSMQSGYVAHLTAERHAEQQTLQLQQKRLTVLTQLFTLQENQVNQWAQWQNQLAWLQVEQQRAYDARQLSARVETLQQEQQQILRTLDHVTQQAVSNTSSTTEAMVLVWRERLALSQLTLLVAELKVRIQPYGYGPSLAQGESMSDIEFRLGQFAQVLQDLSAAHQQAEARIHFLTEKPQLFALVPDGAVYHAQLIQGYTAELRVMSDFTQHIEGLEKENRAVVKKNLSIRQTLPGFDAGAWLALFGQVVSLPWLVLKAAQAMLMQLRYVFTHMTLLEWSLWGVGACAVVGVWYGLRRYLRYVQAILAHKERRFSHNLLWILVKLIDRNWNGVLLATLLIILQTVFDFDIRIFWVLILIYLSYATAVLIARLLLLETVADVSGKDVRLYRELRWLFVAGAIVTAFTWLSYELPISQDAKTFFNRLFLLVVCGFSVLLFRGWSVLPVLLQQIFVVRRAYVMRAIRLFCWVFPATLLTNALIGVIGYVQLAWVIGFIQLIALGILLAYMVVQGLVSDMIEYLYEVVIKRIHHGWLWSQALLRPIDRILKIVLLLGLFWTLSVAYGLNHNAHFWHIVSIIWTATWFNLGSNVVNLRLGVEMAFFASVVAWTGKWSREFAFRWVFSHAKDIGVRNSFSIFTQYTVVILGVIIGLRLIGVDLRGLTVVAAAFAAGIGFGMRDLFSNFFSGVILLVERPFRAGDRVTVAEFEGEVISTGMRSMKVRTWDHMEVIIPNADMFTKPFINWTHQDSIIRTVIPIKIDRVDDPHRVQQLLYAVLQALQPVLDDPSPEVYLRELSDTLLEFEVRYFLNIHEQGSVSRVRSVVLFAIWDAFRAAGIKAPYPHQALEVSSGLMVHPRDE